MLESGQSEEILESLLSNNSSVDSAVIKRQNRFISCFLVVSLVLVSGILIYFFII